jgi:hypothetical protein
MAIDKILHVLNHSKAKKSHRLVLIEIANHINNHGLAWPSYQRLANRTGLVRHWVIKIVSDLVAVGELKIVPNASPTGTNAYRIPTGTVSVPRMKSLGTVSVNEVVQSVYPNLLNTESLSQDETKETWLTPNEAVALGLTPGSRMYRQATGETQTPVPYFAES